MNNHEIAEVLRQIKTMAEEALEKIDGASPAKTSGKKVSTKMRAAPTPTLSFEINTLAFMKKYARGKSGPQKATLLLARLAKGKVSQQVPRVELQKQWDKMTTVMGGPFNPAYMNRATANGWIDSPKQGVCVLAADWKDVLA